MRAINDQAAFHQPIQDLWEYRLVVYPGQDVYNKITEEIMFFDESFHQSTAGKSKPHISIIGFLAKEVMEETMNRWIQNICNLLPPFTVTLNNYSGYPPHTIYLRIQDAAPFRQLANQLKIIDGFIQSNDCPPIHLFTSPHLVLAGPLPEPVYDQAIKEFAHRCFHESFRVEKLVLLKKAWEGGTYELVNTFTLNPALFI
jgi:hypothetical protein